MEQSIENKNKANKTAIIFVVKLLVCYLFFSQGNLFMNSVMSEGGRFYNETIAQNFDYIQGLKYALIKPAVWIIKLFGFYAIHNEMDVMVVNGPYLRINYSCLGLGVMSFLVAFIIAFPAKIKSKINLFIIGMIMIYVLNVFRIAGLGILLRIFRSQRENFTYHHEIFNVIVYVIIFILLYFWIKKNTKSVAKPDSKPNIEKSNEA